MWEALLSWAWDGGGLGAFWVACSLQPSFLTWVRSLGNSSTDLLLCPAWYFFKPKRDTEKGKNLCVFSHWHMNNFASYCFWASKWHVLWSLDFRPFRALKAAVKKALHFKALGFKCSSESCAISLAPRKPDQGAHVWPNRRLNAHFSPLPATTTLNYSSLTLQREEGSLTAQRLTHTTSCPSNK